MKFTLSWLKDHLETTASVDEIAEALTDLGLEVEHLEAGVRRRREPDHLEPVLGGREALGLQGWDAGGNEADPRQPQRLARRLGEAQVGHVHGVERAAEYSAVHSLSVPSPNAMNFWVVSPSMPIGPNQCSLVVETPISAPSPSS